MTAVGDFAFVICVDNVEYPASLELHRAYKVLADDSARSACDVRVGDESGEDYLYPVNYFVAPGTFAISEKLSSKQKKRGARP